MHINFYNFEYFNNTFNEMIYLFSLWNNLCDITYGLNYIRDEYLIFLLDIKEVFN